MRNHSGGFVDDDDFLVFVDDVERNVFGNRVYDRRGGNLAGYLFAGADAMAGFDRFAVDCDVAAADRALYGRPARFTEARGEEKVEALVSGLNGNREGETGRRGDRERGRQGDKGNGRRKIAARKLVVLPLNGNELRVIFRLPGAIYPCLPFPLSPCPLAFLISQRRVPSGSARSARWSCANLNGETSSYLWSGCGRASPSASASI